jgi:hypothetical protein
MQVIPSNEFLVLITKPVALTAEQRVPQWATLSADGTTFYIIRERKGTIAVGYRSVKVIACGIKFKTKVK